MKDFSSSSFNVLTSTSRICIVIVLLFLSCVFFTACGCIGIGNCNGNNIGGSSGGSVDGGPPSGATSSPVSCIGGEKTDPEIPDQGKTVTFPSVIVPDGCDVIVQGVMGQNIGSYNWTYGGVAALGPGTYTFTIQDGSYQITNDTDGNTAFCDAVHWIQSTGRALGVLYPLSGWTSC